MDPNSFQETGNQIPIPIDEMIEFVHHKLDEFNYIVKATHNKPTQTPFYNDIIYPTADGKLVKIPKFIQDQAIKLWFEKNQKGEVVSNNKNPTNKAPTPTNINSQKKVVEETDYRNTIIFSLVLLVILGLYYYFYKRSLA